MSVSVDECVNILREARHELVALRRQVADLEPRAKAWDVMSRVVGMIPVAPQGYGTDIVWSIEQLLNDVEVSTAEAEG